MLRRNRRMIGMMNAGGGSPPGRSGGGEEEPAVLIDTITFDGSNYEVNGVDGGTGDVCKIDKATGVAEFIITPTGDVTVTAVGYGGDGAAAGKGGGGGAFTQALLASVASGDTMTVTMAPETVARYYYCFVLDKTSTVIVSSENGNDGGTAYPGLGGAAVFGTTKHSGGNGGAPFGGPDGGGGGGGTGGSAADGNNGSDGTEGIGGAGGVAVTDGYAGGAGGDNGKSGSDAPSYGGGGGGAGTGGAGGAGGPGVIFIAGVV